MSVSLFMFDIDISGTRYFVAYIQLNYKEKQGNSCIIKS